jgi:hypothetical protein
MKDYREKAKKAETGARRQEAGRRSQETRGSRIGILLLRKAETQSFWPKREVPLFLTKSKCDFLET